MKLLIGAAPSKIFHLQEFAKALEKYDVETMIVNDAEIFDGFPSRNIKNWLQSKKKFKEIIKNFEPDLIFSDRQRHFGLASTELKIPSLIHLRGDFWSEIKWAKETEYNSGIKKIAISKWEEIGEKCFDQSTLILPICKYLDNIVQTKYPGKSSVLYQGIDPKKWHKSEGLKLQHPCVGFLQSATIWGKTKELLTMEKVISKFPNVSFYWVGDGPFREQISSVLSKYDNFQWLGSLQYPDKVREFLTEIDIYALASGIDMSPLTLLEAQLMTKPVIATNVGGIPELMKNGETGFLVEKNNPEQWIEKLDLLLNDEQKRNELGNNGRKFVEENFSWDKIAKEFLEILKNNNLT